ncbi:protein-L-isoaspartate O-methyltransferase domain-containing protein 1 isoform X1 [Osmia lignaria lignaria]|uniref:protein-L-isoaspartate O-methyltransferase domain-containing protein 1 isoform X1 n=1 Tax=Osmia lignaria lignaria TaxID=1437193 RepID=UPI001478D8FD|nr:protein-L-isoaspartate O-methyltransferase domain-containing protein 1-like isoform X1 [Osmia lignaria]XP_034175729.1 protein-L-isoaspartate O-methyltransferase domain-containing protein 1-like isoform X1 [Osmia lignaria]XP_034175730.1 protein-L-isoaspartate O-methyltransferase domain-containing protein 1-like isoform X1 [Osmia lignaria]XP_034175731.1 protein-L-isoaspartate O-methyltransferase domain-containing protein 1-like isoform X1 [Osmia lignaria]
MGTTVSSGQNNDELVDDLMKSGYIRTKEVEKVFRAVDRADYVLPLHREIAYKDIAWKHGNIHLSAPCIYSEVMEALFLEPGLSFLNLGSGTGYLSTMAGLILSQHGTNHGIELHEDCLKYAYERLEEFKQKSLALDEFDFCEPLFIQGNCLNVAPGRQYDRVYCGAACPEGHEGFIRQFVRVGGILVMPFKDHLLRIHRIDEDTWLHFTMLSVSFSTLVVPIASEQTLFHLPECDPLSLQELCRGKIRDRLRLNVWVEHADLETTKLIVPERRKLSPPPHQTLRRFVIPIFEESDEAVSDGGEEFSRAVCFLLSVDTHPSEQCTSQVRTVVQTNPNENQNWRKASNSGSSGQYNQNVENFGNRSSSMKDSFFNADASNNAEGVSSSTDERSQENIIHTQRIINVNENIATAICLNISDSDTDSDDDDNDTDSEADHEETLVQRKKVAKREKTDSGIVEDVNLSNEEGSSSSNTNHSDLETVYPSETADAMDSDLSDITINRNFNPHSVTSDKYPKDEVIVAHYVNKNAFSTFMREKIHQLPLPFALKLYIAYNREL